MFIPETQQKQTHNTQLRKEVT